MGGRLAQEEKGLQDDILSLDEAVRLARSNRQVRFLVLLLSFFAVGLASVLRWLCCQSCLTYLGIVGSQRKWRHERAVGPCCNIQRCINRALGWPRI